jgi:hypothetical protein
VFGVNTLDLASENLRIYNRRLDSVLDYYDNNVVKIWASSSRLRYNNSRAILLGVKDIVRYSIVNEPGTLLPQLTFEEAYQLEIEILDVEYALVCFR